MTWNHRIVAEEVDGETTFRIHEVFYDGDQPTLWTEDAVIPCGDSLQAIRHEYEMMRLAFFRPALHVHAENGKSVLKSDDSDDGKLDDYHRHEALDRAAIFAEQFESHIASHPQIELDPRLRSKAEEIADRLAALYQAIGNLDENGS
ncbi:MAG: hypothetical protein R3F19_34725, partial [Verrucomicrobiales bacterium]